MLQAGDSSPQGDDERQRVADQLGMGEIHLVLTEKADILVSVDELEEALRREAEPTPDEWFLERVLRREIRPSRLPEYLDFLKRMKINVDLRLHIHRVRKVIKRGPSLADIERGLEGLYERKHDSVYLGVLQVRGSKVFFNGVEQRDDALQEWLNVCIKAGWKDPGFSSERATELAKLIGTHLRETELRSLETLRRTLGDEVADRLLRDRKVTVESSSGQEYVITDSAEVYRRSSSGGMEHVCVRVRGEEDLPKYDRVLAKYLVIRDHPEQITTLLDRRAIERERDRLMCEIERLREQLGELERRRAQIDAGATGSGIAQAEG